MVRLESLLEGISGLVGRAVAWLTLLMVLFTFAIVVLRYGFGLGWIWLQESVTFMHAAVFMLAAAWTLSRGDHVRVDVFYRRLAPRGQAVVDIVGTCLFLVPFSAFLLWTGWDYVANSFAIREASREAGGLRYPWPSLQKSMILVMALLLLMQACALLIRALIQLRTPEAAPTAEDARGGL